VGYGGHPLENALCGSGSDTTPAGGDCGDYASEFTMNAGSYYDKTNSIIFMTESEDRFISQSRQDFYDARFRAAGIMDLFPDGVRRLLANGLTFDREVLGTHVAAQTNGSPLLTQNPGNTTNPDAPFYDPQGAFYPDRPVAWTSFWPSGGPQVCLPVEGRNACFVYPKGGSCVPDPADTTKCLGDLTPDKLPARMASIDPQIGWEVQKFLIAWGVLYITSNDRPEWIDQMRIYRESQGNASPSFEARIEWQDPWSGQVYYAKTYGTECLFGDPANNCAGGKIVQKGIAARVLEYANSLTAKGYVVDSVNEFGRVIVARHADGTPIVSHDDTVMDITPDGKFLQPTCDPEVDAGCVLTVAQNRAAKMLGDYKAIPDFLWEVVVTYGLSDPEQHGLYDL
jgi:hypothetical protein